ncbi:anti-sigma factor family protein [Lutispora thermophila]|uniref:Putative zinc-finger n=1 Tax=Lutispora thermophila DSM 19022 TaxID=1122184 RepID=A0A1M6ATD7_9FIRM|nr:zf-HC2 domain-containing protein [Lutispora thermophila]SHI39784.1 Putative zinc-finger [Lutispora thermophila DSM 19022]
MECSEVSNLIMKYIDGDISEVELKLLNKHILSCESCHEEFQMMTEMIKCINEMPEISPPCDLEEKIMNRINREREASSMVNMLIGAAGMFAFAYYMIIFVILPFMRDAGIGQILLGYGAFVLGIIDRYFIGILVYLPITINNLLTLRKILLQDYMNIMIFISGVVMVLNLGLIRIINLQRE